MVTVSMVFSSFGFLFVFFPALLLFYYFPFCKKRAWKNGILLCFSLAFYGCGGLRLLPLILLSIGLNYLCGCLADASRTGRSRKAALYLAVMGNLGLLFFFKYLGFLSENVNLLFPSLPVYDILLPIGISFYTFQGLSYVIDVYRGAVPAERSPWNLALYIALFPQLVAGPIVRYHTISHEILHRQESWEDVSVGMTRFLFGLAKKILIANPMGQIADAAFGQATDMLSTSLAWLGVLAYTLQIYFDFSGYSDMAIGLGRVFGFRFLENFNYPYVANSVTDFWRRWHISLSSWFRDYLYIPLGGNRGGVGKQIRNLLIVWVLTGFWHGAAWNFLLWGLYYALLLIGERYVWRKLLEKTPAVLRHLYAILCILFGWLLFRAVGFAQIGDFLAAMFGQGSAGLWSDQVTYLLLQYRLELIVGLLAALPWKPCLQAALEQRGEQRGIQWMLLGAPRVLALLLGVLSCAQLISSGFNPFIYFQF